MSRQHTHTHTHTHTHRLQKSCHCLCTTLGEKHGKLCSFLYSRTVFFLDDVHIRDTPSNILCHYLHYAHPSSVFFLLSNLTPASSLSVWPLCFGGHEMSGGRRRLCLSPGFALNKPCTKIQLCIILMCVSLLVSRVQFTRGFVAARTIHCIGCYIKLMRLC